MPTSRMCNFLLPASCLRAPTLFLGIVAAWRLVALCTLMSVAVGVAVAFIMTPVFRAEGRALPTAEDVSARGAMAGVADLAALAGINVGSDSTAQEHFEILQSGKFLAEFIVERNKLPEIYAESWDGAAGHWKQGVEPPTMGRALKRVREGMLFISQDRKTGVITVAFRHRDPTVAAQWVNDYFADANRKIRDAEVGRIDRMIEYLDAQAEKPNQPIEVKQAIYRLVEDQMKRLSLAMSDREYAFRVIEPARVPENWEKVAPVKRSIALVALMAGLMLGGGIVLTGRALADKGMPLQ